MNVKFTIRLFSFDKVKISFVVEKRSFCAGAK